MIRFMKEPALIVVLLCSVLICSCEQKNEKETILSTEEAKAQYEKAKELAIKAKNGSKEDFEQMLHWTQKAAENGYREAVMTLAALYYYGNEYISRDAEKARKWFERAAKQGVAEAHFFLGEIYAQGDGIAQDLNRAVAEWDRAAQAGIAEAEYSLGIYFLDKEHDNSRGIMWCKRAADHAHVKASLLLGKMYAQGYESLSPDMHEAAKWYLRAAEGGNSQAQYIYGLMCLTGSGVPLDKEQGLLWIMLSAGQNNRSAIRQLIHCYEEGIGTQRNTDSADAWKKRLQELDTQSDASKKPSDSHR